MWQCTFSPGCLQDPTLKMCHQNSMRFYGRIVYDRKYSGGAELIEEGKRMGGVLGNYDVMMLCNHGAVSAADDIPRAFDYLYYLERSAMYQVIHIQCYQVFTAL